MFMIAVKFEWKKFRKLVKSSKTKKRSVVFCFYAGNNLHEQDTKVLKKKIKYCAFYYN